MNVVEAYMSPTVDDSAETFSWGTPDVDGLKQYPSSLDVLLWLLMHSIEFCLFQEFVYSEYYGVCYNAQDTMQLYIAPNKALYSAKSVDIFLISPQKCPPRWLSWLRFRLVTKRLQIRPPSGSATFFRGD